MTQEEKQLLLIDLCGRLLYGIVVLTDIDKKFDGGYIAELVSIVEHKGEKLFYVRSSPTPFTIEEIRPYLRPMSSMTEEEIKECEMYRLVGGGWTDDGFDWLNEHYFDYRGLIPMGLAVEAPEGMYNI